MSILDVKREHAGTALSLAISVPLLFVFGGCCSSLLTLEQLLKDNRDIGTFLTAAQFAFVAALRASGFVHISRKGIKFSGSVPLTRWVAQVRHSLTICMRE